MKNIKLLTLEKYNNASNYQLVEEGIYKDLTAKNINDCRMALSLELEIEVGDNSQYPLEDVLDLYYVYVTDFYEKKLNNKTTITLEFAGELNDIRAIKSIIGRRIYNKTRIDREGNSYTTLVIEPPIDFKSLVTENKQ